MRYFHDLYANFNLGEKWSGIAGFDVGAEQNAKEVKNIIYGILPIYC